MPISDFPDRKYLINARELGERLGAVTLIDLRPAEDFSLGHIEGSKHLDIYGVSLNDSSDAPLNAFLSIFQTLFGTRGVSPDKPVVIYDHETGERAARAVWLLAVLGHPDVRILDGGTQAWAAAGQGAPPPAGSHGPRNGSGAPGPLFRAPILGLAPDIDNDRLFIIDGAMDIEPGCQQFEIWRSFVRGRRRRRFCRVDRPGCRRQANEPLARRGPCLRSAVQNPDVRVTQNREEPARSRRPLAGLVVVDHYWLILGYAPGSEQYLKY